MKIGEPGVHSQLGLRDSFHVGCVMVQSNEGNLKPGQAVRFTNHRMTTVEACRPDKKHAIVDPFLEEVGLYFLVLVAPGLVGPLVHNFAIKSVDGFDSYPPEPDPVTMDVVDDDDGCKGCW